MFYIRPKSEQISRRWDEIAQIDQLPVHRPSPQDGLWQVNAAALNIWVVRSIAAHMARKQRQGRETWTEAASRIFQQIRDGFTVSAEEWELTPETNVSGVFAWPGVTRSPSPLRARGLEPDGVGGIFLLATHYV